MADHIQIGDVSPRVQYVANGAQTQFTYPFPIFAAADMEVYLGTVRQTTSFTVAGAGASAGGSVTFAAAPADGETVTLRRRVAIKRTSDFQESGEFRAKVINDELDYQTAALQQVADDGARSLRLAATDTAGDLTLPLKAARAGKALTFDPVTGDPAATGFADLPADVSLPLAVLQGGTGADTAADARLNLGCGTAATRNAAAGSGDLLPADGNGSQLTNLPIDSSLAADIRVLALEVAALNGDRLNMVDGWADPLKDETDIETGSNVNATFVAGGGGYYHNPVSAFDSYSETNQNTFYTISSTGSNGSAVGQALTIGSTQNVTRADFYLRKTGSPTGTAVAKLYAATGTVGTNAVPTGAALATSGTLDVSTLTGSFALKSFAFASPYAAGAGNYVAVVEYSGGDGSNYVEVGLDTTSPTHGGNACKYNYTPAWVAEAYDVIFYLCGQPGDMTVVSKQAVAAASAPTVGRLHVQIKDITGGSVVNTDFKGYVSRDNGATYTQGTLALARTLADGTTAYEFDDLDISAQPSGTQPRFKFTTHNNKQIQLHGVVVQWK